MEGLCEGDLDKMGEVHVGGVMRTMDNQSIKVSEDCSKAGGVSHVKASIDPVMFNSLYLSVGKIMADLEITYNNNVTQKASVFVDNGKMNNTNEMTLYGAVSF